MTRKENFDRIIKEKPGFAKIIKRNKKWSKFNEEYEDIMEDDTMEVNEHLRNLTETNDIFGNLGKI